MNYLRLILLTRLILTVINDINNSENFMCTLVGVQVHVLPVIAFLFRLVLIKQTIPCLTDSFLSVPRYLDFVQTTTQATLSGFSLNKNSPGPLPCPASPTRCYSLPVLATLAFFAVLLSIVLPLSVVP